MLIRILITRLTLYCRNVTCRKCRRAHTKIYHPCHEEPLVLRRSLVIHQGRHQFATYQIKWQNHRRITILNCHLPKVKPVNSKIYYQKAYCSSCNERQFQVNIFFLSNYPLILFNQKMGYCIFNPYHQHSIHHSMPSKVICEFFHFTNSALFLRH